MMKPRQLLELDRLRPLTGCTICGDQAAPDSVLCVPCEQAVLEEDDEWWTEPAYDDPYDFGDDLPF